MSHYVKVQTSIKNDSLLKKSLKRMGLYFEEGEFQITQYGTTEKAQIKFENALGLQKQQDGTWSLVGDPYHCNNKKLRAYYRNTSQFNQELKVAYSILDTTKQLEGMNFACTENAQGSVGPNGKIKMVFNYLGV
jgi:hypothetical protein